MSRVRQGLAVAGRSRRVAGGLQGGVTGMAAAADSVKRGVEAQLLLAFGTDALLVASRYSIATPCPFALFTGVHFNPIFEETLGSSRRAWRGMTGSTEVDAKVHDGQAPAYWTSRRRSVGRIPRNNAG